MIRRPPRSTQSRSSAASDVYKRQVQTRTGSHGCCDTNHTLIFFGQMDQGLAEGLCVTYGSGSTIYLLSGLDGKGCCSMETVRSLLRRGVALPFHSFHME